MKRTGLRFAAALACAVAGVATGTGEASAQGMTPFGDVLVINPPEMPVPTAPVLPGGTPVQAQESSGFGCGNGSCGVDVYTVPEGKLLIIEFLSVRTDFASNTADQFRWGVSTKLGGTFVQHDLGPVHRLPELGINSQSAAAMNLRLYADPGTEVRVSVHNGSFQSIDFVLASMSGRLVDF